MLAHRTMSVRALLTSVVAVNAISVLWIRYNADVESSQSADPWCPLLLGANNELDLGVVSVNSETVFAADLKNTAAEPVRIAGVSASCGCLDVDVSPNIVHPSELVHLSGRMRAKAHESKIATQIALRLVGMTSGRRGTAECLITASITARVKITPEHIVLNPGSDSPTTVEISLQNSDPRDIVVIARPENEGVLQVGESQQVECRIPAGGKSAIRITTPFQQQRILTSLVVSVVGTDEVHRVPVTIQPQTGLISDPAVLLLGVVEKDNGKWTSTIAPTLCLSAPNRPGAKIHLASAPRFFAEPRIDQSQGKSTVSYSFREDWNGTSCSGVIEVHLTDADNTMLETLRIPVAGALRRDQHFAPE